MMSTNFEQLLQPYSIESGSLLPVIFNIFSLWRLTGQQQMTLLGLSNEKTLYNWKKPAGESKADSGLSGTGQLYPWHLSGVTDSFRDEA
tara:strand:+ start:276 stop:542 length:267 start_codon:yes stop_codon:yes gene_type:complete